MTTVTESPTRRPASLRAAWPALVGLSVVFLAEMLDNTVLTVALPTIAGDLHAGAVLLQWVVGAYSLLFGGLMLAFGAVADRFGRRRVMLVGLALFGLASLAVLAVRTPGELIAVRAATGVAAAMTAPGSMALSFRLFDDDALRARASALITSIGMAGLAVGPILGGFALAAVPWQALLLVNAPLAVLAGLGIRRGIPADDPADLHRLPIDAAGAVLGTATTVLALWTPTLVLQHGWSTWPPLTTAVAAVACGTAFVLRERSIAHPILDLSLLSRGAVAAGLITQLALALALAGLGYTVTLQLQLAWGWSPAQAALGGLPQVLTMLASGGLVQPLMRRLGMQRAGLAGAAAVLAGLVLYAVLGRHGYGWMALAMVFVAAGMRPVMVTSTISILRGLPSDRTSIGAALADTGQELGSAIGLALVGTMIAAAISGPLTGGWSAARTTAFEDAVSSAGLALAVIAAVLIGCATVRSRRRGPTTAR